MMDMSVQKRPISGRRAAPWAASNRERKYLPEVQGLRALAVLMVVSYHVWFGRISGGVDVFLLISAFLLTAQFTRKLESGRALELAKYWCYLFKRLLPLVVLTIIGTLWGIHALVPETRWTSLLGQTWASLLYFQNWFLASEAVDYYATDHSAASPFQHFWSLSIQGQIFIVWPLIFAIAAAVSKAARLRIRPLLIYLFGTIFISSLVFSIITTNNNQAFAYFDTRTRLWEFALGSLLALVLPYLRFNRSLRVFLGWLGVAAMLSCGLILQVGQKFPGYMALWPTLAAALVIVAGSTNSRFGADAFLSWKPLVRLGDSSYALYLVHWPILVFALLYFNRDHAGVMLGSAIVGISLIVAIIATKLIDAPLRRSEWAAKKRRRALLSIAICLAVVAAPLSAWQAQIRAQEAELQALDQAAETELLRNYPGALSLQQGFIDEADPDLAIRPALTALDKQWVALDQGCADQFAPTDSVLENRCTQNVLDVNAKKTIFIVGDSHAQQFTGALIPIAERNNWRLVSLLLGGCDFGISLNLTEASSECDRFNSAAADYVLQKRPDAVFTISTDTVADSPDEKIITGYEEAVSKITGAGIEVLGIRDNPRFSENKASCVASLGSDACSFDLASNMAPTNPAERLNEIDKSHMIDLTDQYCTDGKCFAAAGNVLVYLDHNHLTLDYARTMAPALAERIAQATGWKLK